MNLIILGASGYANVIIDIIEHLTNCKLVGLVDKDVNSDNPILGYPILGCDDDLDLIIEKYNIEGYAIAVGDNYIRSKIAHRMLNKYPHLKAPALIHPCAHVGKAVQIGDGTVVMAGATINPNTRIGSFSIANTNCSIDHDNVIGNYCSFGPNSTSGGNVHVQDYSIIALSASIIHGIHVGENALLGAGAVLTSNLPQHSLALGMPAKVIRTRKLGEKYL